MDKTQELKSVRASLEKKAAKARERITSLVDPMSFVELGAFVKARGASLAADSADTTADGVVTGYGTIEDRLVFVYSQDPETMGGAVGELHAAKIAALYERAVEVGAPVIGILDSTGLRLAEQQEALSGYGRIYNAIAKASGVVPTVSVVVGTAAGGAAIIAGMTDFAVMAESGAKVFVSSANAMEKGTTFEAIASAATHAGKSGLADATAPDEAGCFAMVRELVDMLPANNEEDAPLYEDEDELNRVSTYLEDVSESEGVDVHTVITELADKNEFFETKAAYAPGMVTGFMRLNGGTVGVVANNGAVEDGALTAEGCRKAVELIRFCDAFELPVLSIVDTIGFTASKAEENAGLAAAAAKLTAAFATTSSSKVTLVTGKAYGSASLVMNSKENGADVVLSWPAAKFAMMDAVSEARILYADEIAAGTDLSELAAKVEELQTPYAAAARGSVDDVIEPAATRKYLLVSFGMLAGKRPLLPQKKHDTLL